MKEILDYLFNGWTIEEIRGLVALIMLLGIVVGLMTFIIERSIARYNRKSENRKKWLIEIIISPEIENINKYFEDFILNFESQINELTDSTNLKIESAQVFLLKKAKFISEGHGFNKIFIDTFVGLIYEYDKNVGSTLKNLMVSLTDKYTTSIGNLSIDDKSTIQEFSQFCNFIKSKFYRELFKMVDY